jgi:hypothetical protein
MLNSGRLQGTKEENALPPLSETGKGLGALPWLSPVELVLWLLWLLLPLLPVLPGLGLWGNAPDIVAGKGRTSLERRWNKGQDAHRDAYALSEASVVALLACSLAAGRLPALFVSRPRCILSRPRLAQRPRRLTHTRAHPSCRIPSPSPSCSAAVTLAARAVERVSVHADSPGLSTNKSNQK